MRRRRRPAAGGYIDCRSTVREAARAGLSVTDYVERLWNQKGCTAEVVKNILATCNSSGSLERVVEIGPGTGRYLETIQAIHPGAVHEIYETADDWAGYLETFPHVIRRECSGETLGPTPTGSADLCHAHGVFVYTPFLVTVSYMREMARVVRPAGIVAFDVYSENSFRPADIDAWLSSEYRYPCYIGSEMVTRGLADHLNLSLVDRFPTKHGQSRSEYFVFRKQGHA